MPIRFPSLTLAFTLWLSGFIQAADEPLRVVSYNVWYGFTKAPERKAAYLEWMKAQKPDVVSLQELNGYTAEKLQADATTWGHKHSAILKENGFPTGITSSHPIEDIQRLREGFHHGLLRAKIKGIYFYVIHLHPSNWQTRQREADLILKDIASLPEGSEVALVGDFNTFSPADREYYAHGKLEPFFGERDAKYKEKNLRGGKLDFSVIEKFTTAGLIDLDHSQRGEDFHFTGSFPTKIEKAGDHGSARRLDYVFASATLAKRTTRAEVIADETTWKLSDHLPVIVDFKGSAETGWTELCEGKSLDQWRGYQKEGLPASWEVRDGSIFCNGKDDAHLITRKKYADYELTGEWKISKGGNSGILLRVVEVTPWPATSGLEVQVIDHSDGWKEVHGGGLGPGQAAGALYGIYPAKEAAVKKAGEWNTVRIKVVGSKIQLWQNGTQLVDADMQSEGWNKRLAGSKFAKSEHFNRAATGHIALQNYRGAGVWFRNLKVREIASGE